MVFELSSDEYAKIRPLFASLKYHLAIESIIQRLTPSMVLVDNKKSPTTAFTWYKNRAWLAGNPKNQAFNEALLEFLKETFFRELIRHGANQFLLVYAPSAWKLHLDPVFKPKSRVEGLRHYYQLGVSAQSWDIPIPRDLSLHSINASLLSKKYLKDLEDVVEEMQSERSTVQEFLEKSFGYYARIRNEIVGWCMSEYNAANRCEVGIATIVTHRRQGIAILLGNALIKYAFTHGITCIGWHCWADNSPSIATARKLGFEKYVEYPVTFISI